LRFVSIGCSGFVPAENVILFSLGAHLDGNPIRYQPERFSGIQWKWGAQAAGPRCSAARRTHPATPIGNQTVFLATQPDGILLIVLMILGTTTLTGLLIFWFLR
jgi:hypothetical protein